MKDEAEDSETRGITKQGLEAFFKNPLRRGYAGQISAGISPILSASDHFPVMWKDELSEISVLSWNMLSDTHLYNSFLNVANINSFSATLQENEDLKDTYYAKRLNSFFYELSEFARLNQGFDEEVKRFYYSPEHFQEFINSDYFYSRDLSNEQKRERILERQALGDWFLNLPAPTAGAAEALCSKDFSTSIAHSLQILHFIEYGGLKWSERKKSILPKATETMKNILASAGFICLQECTDPQDIMSMINETITPQMSAGKDDEYGMLVYKVDPESSSTDHCVIIYNKSIYELNERQDLSLAHGKKPAIIARFTYKNNESEKVTIGSIHHPGGRENDMHRIMRAIERLPASTIAVAGDFNHTEDFFTGHTGSLKIFSAPSGTMAAGDFGNKGKPIDLVIANKNGSMEILCDFMEPHLSSTAHIYIEANPVQNSDDSIPPLARKDLISNYGRVGPPNLTPSYTDHPSKTKYKSP